MKHNPITTANALAVTSGILYAGCRLLVVLFPDLSFSIAQAWFHGLTVEKFSSTNLTGANFLLGLVTFVIFAWVTGYIFAKIYNLMKS